MPALCVFCASSTEIDDRYVALAAEVGTQVGERDWTLVTGGGSISCMGAIAVAARAAGGHTVGVIPEALAELEVADHDADELVITADMRERKGEMDRRADAFLALPGGIGTLEELLEIWVSASLGMHSKPVVVLDPWGDFAPLRTLVDHLAATGFVRPEALDLLVWTTSVSEAFHAVENAWGDPHKASNPSREELLESEP